MNLEFNFKDKLFWIHNFLPKETYKNMYVEFLKNRNKLNFKKTFVHWKTFKEEFDNMSESYNQEDKKSKNLNQYLTIQFLLNYLILYFLNLIYLLFI